MGNTIAVFPITFSFRTNFFCYFKTCYKLELVEAEMKRTATSQQDNGHFHFYFLLSIIKVSLCKPCTTILKNLNNLILEGVHGPRLQSDINGTYHFTSGQLPSHLSSLLYVQ